MNHTRLLSREEEPTNDVSVTREDQDRINNFSSLHQSVSLLSELLSELATEKETLSDAAGELELFDDEDMVPYKLGDSFVQLALAEVQELLEKGQERVDAEIAELEKKIEGKREEMEKLKIGLYAKFGKAINLDV